MWYFRYNALINALASTLFGAIAFGKNPSASKSRSYALYCFSLSLWSYSYVFWQLSSTASSALFFCRALMMGAILIPITHVHHLLDLFEWKAPQVLIVGYTVCALFLISNFTPLFISGVSRQLLFKYWPLPGPLFPSYLVGFFLCLSYSLVMIYRAHRSAIGYKRNLLSWVFVATVIGYGGGATNFPLWYGIGINPVGNCLVSIYTTIVFYILSHYRLLDIAVVVRRTLIYSVVMIVLTALYIFIVGLFTRLFEGLTGNETIFASAGAAALITLCFQPLRKWVQAFVDRKFFRQFVDREEKLYELSREVITHTTPEAMAEALMRVLGESFHPKSAILYLRSTNASGFMPVAFLGLESPASMAADNPLSLYFAHHSQPFVQDFPSTMGAPQSTRQEPHKVRGAKEAA